MERQKFPKPHIYVFNSGACHGHYLTYLIDRLSKNSPAIKQLPFNDIGNSHNDVDYSGFSHFVDSPVQDQYKTLKNQNIIKILYGNDILYHERAAMARGGDGFADVYTAHNDISFFKKYNNQFYEKIRSLYSVDNDRVPKWLLRDAYKMGFLDWEKQGSVVTAKQDVRWIEENLGKDNKIHYTEVNVFFTAETLTAELQRLDNEFDLNLDFSELGSIHEEFLARNNVLQTQENTGIVIDAIQNKQDITIPPLDIIQQAYVYAQLEKKHDFVIMPMTEDFFKTTKEIIDYITLYPQHYKAMNPNLPKFNNIDNPFFLHRQKNKSVL